MVELSPRTRRSWPSLALGGALLAGAALWVARAPIAEGVARDYLEERGVASRYRVAGLSARRIVLDDVSLGPVGRPEFAAERVVVDVAWRGGRPVPVALRLDAPVLRADLTGARPSLGSLDALLPPPSDEPFEWPDLALAVTRGVLIAATPAGPVRLAITGEGKLDERFAGRVTLAPADLRFADCSAPGVAGSGRVALVDRVATIDATVGAATLACGDVSAGPWRSAADGRVPEALDRFDGRVTARLATLRAGTAQAAAATARFDGAVAQRIEGRWALAVSNAAVAGSAAERVAAAGTVAGTPSDVRAEGVAAATVARLDPVLARRFAAPEVLTATPLAPLAASGAEALRRAARRFDARAPFVVTRAGGRTLATTTGVDLFATTGARGRFEGEARATLPGIEAGGAGRVTIAGGGLPSATLELDRFDWSGDGMSAAGRLAVPSWRAGGAALAAPSLAFEHGAARSALRGIVTMSGPIAGGRVEGLRLPLDVALTERGTSVAGGCLRPSFERLAVASVVIDAARLALCDGALGGGRGALRVAPFKVAGRLGGTPFTLAAAGGRIEPATLGWRLNGVDARFDLDRGALDVAAATVDGRGTSGGRFVGGGVGGVAAPFVLSAATGRWAFDDGALRIADASLDMSDVPPERREAAADALPRYQPVHVQAIQGALVYGVVDATAEARHRPGGPLLADIRLRHDVGSGVGEAVLDMESLAFGEGLQPYQLTEVARGLVENVVGTIAGDGVVRWTPAGVTSEGRVEVRDVALATAGLGPVTGVAGTILFNDLLGLTTPPGQRLAIGSVNPGILVEHGTIGFQLLPDRNVAVEGGSWPFAGGTLTLDPTVIDTATLDRRYVLRVDGLDAAAFLKSLELEKLVVTGVFDGVLPLEFDESGGRIVGGRLASRKGGGTIAYVGEIGSDTMHVAARLAFDALRRLRYDALALDLDGDLDGEIVTGIRFAGVNEEPVTPSPGLPFKATGLPFKFNVTVRAPFRGLMSSAASLADARGLLREGAAQEPPK